MESLPYDKTSKESIYNYALQLIDKTFRDIIKTNYILKEDSEPYDYGDFNGKGNLGNLIEEEFFHYKKNNISEADFPEAGLELKVTPFIQNKNGSYRAKERLVLGMIDYMKHYKESDFIQSHIYKKCATMLLVNYLYEPTKERLDYLIKFVTLFELPKEDLEIIKNDYKIIIDKIKSGKAEDLSESDTNYLGACTKGANSKSLAQQPFSNIKAMHRAFCLKNSYMTYILNNYIINKNEKYESAVKNINELKNQSLEEYIIKELKPYYNEDVIKLAYEFNLENSYKNKAFTFQLAKKMLKISNEYIEEFEKANIKIKAITLNKNGKPEENMSFPAFKYNEIIKETWLDSTLYETFSTTKYLFMIFERIDNNTLIFKKAMFWHVPQHDLDTEIKRVWEETIKRIKANQYNNLPRSSESPILHVRPHARNSKDTYPTPDGKQATKKCFWFNMNYIKQQIEESED